ncbi:MAG: hypothetical protein ACR2QB_07500 [Gammaproteobacteria bacterium]
MSKGNALRVTRQLTLGLIALALLGGSWLGQRRATSWEETLWVTVYPVVHGVEPATSDYVAALSSEDFEPLTGFVAAEAARWGVDIEKPMRIDLGQTVGLPPAPPAEPSLFSVLAWSLKLRWWAWRELADAPGPSPDIRLFAVFHDPVAGIALPHSVGMKEGRIGIAHLFAHRRMRGSNQVVIAHELLHTLGATDKYDPMTNRPVFPEGYAEPELQPRYPQRYAEIMGGRIPVAPKSAEIPAELADTRIGDLTALELRWIE